MRKIFVLSTVLLLAAPLHAGTIKKWVDENGVTHYGTTIPPRYRENAYRELNEDGIVVRRHERALTEEEIERERALALLRTEQQKILEEQRASDRRLLKLYRNEDDLVMARDGAVAQIDGQIRLSYATIRRLKNRLSELHAVAADAERRGRVLNTQQQANLDSTQRSIESSYSMILGKEEEKKSTLTRYNIDLERFRALRRGAARSENADKIVQSEFPDLVDTAIRCTTEAECQRLWDAAQKYARRHATTPVNLAAERILVTAPPRELRDLSITVSRLTDRDGDGERIFMDVQCARFTEGREFCRGPEVDAIRANFKVELSKEVPTIRG